MSAYKYMTDEKGLRFLRSWFLRITPPADFNDPFELRPPAGRLFTEEYVDALFQEEALQIAITYLTEQLTPDLSGRLTQQEITEMVTCMVAPPDGRTQAHILKNFAQKLPGVSSPIFLQFQERLQSQWPVLMQQARELTSAHLPEFNSILKKGFTEKLPALLGVLCLSKNSNQPLMWAHYADSHKGLMIEFDTAHATFNRQRSAADDFGHLRPVSYSTLRPELTMHTFDGNNAFEVFALTKADPWKYEEEIRLIWPLEFADKTVETPLGAIGLLSCPSSAVVSVTLGCKASEKTLSAVRETLEDQPHAAHIRIRRAKLDESAFELRYHDV